MMADHQHIKMLFQRVYAIGPGRVGRRRDHMPFTAYLDNIRGMTAASPFGMKGMDGPALHRGNRVFNKAAFVQRIGVDHHLDIHFIGHAETVIYSRRCRAPIFMQF